MSDIPQYADTSIERTRLDIMARLKSYPRLNGIQIERGPLTDGEYAKTDKEGLINGYIVVNFGGRGRVAGGLQGITGTRDDLRRFLFGIEVYGRSSIAKDRISDDVWDALEGYEPFNCGELSAENSGKIANPLNTRQNVTREGIGLIFYCYIGTITKSPIAPTPEPEPDPVALVPVPGMPGYSVLSGVQESNLEGYYTLEIES